MSSFGSRLKEAREKVRLTQDALAKKFDPPVSRNAVSRWESNTDMPSGDKLQVIARSVRESVDYLLTGRGKRDIENIELGPDLEGTVPLISWVQAGLFASLVDNLHPGDAFERIKTSVPIHQHTYALRVKGDSMVNPLGDPSFPEGSVIIVEPDAINSPDNLVGSLVIVARRNDEEATFKKLVRDGGKFYLMPLNPRYERLDLREDDVICGVVRSREQRFF